MVRQEAEMAEVQRVEHYLVVDLEATTSNDGSLPRDEMETIEIGAVLVDSRSLEAEGEFQSFVRPVRHPVLTPFCMSLTGIGQAEVDAAPLFPEVLEDFRRRMLDGRDGVVFGSWGDFDRMQIARDCAFHGVADPMPAHVNLKALLSEVQERRRRYGMAAALRLCDLTLEGAHHRGIDDARNIARLLPWVVGGRRISSR